MHKLIELYKKSVIEGLSSFFWLSNNSISYPYIYASRAIFEDRKNLGADFRAATANLERTKHDKEEIFR